MFSYNIGLIFVWVFGVANETPNAKLAWLGCGLYDVRVAALDGSLPLPRNLMFLGGRCG